MEIPASLRRWFVAHAIIDGACGIPLLTCPELLLPRVGWTAVDPLMSRLVGAALLAIGAQAWRSRNAGVDVYRALLGLNVVWSAMVIVGMAVAIGQGAPSAAFAVLSASLALCGVWTHHAIRFRQLSRVSAAADGDADVAGGEEAEQLEHATGEPPTDASA
jgi:hypothetical protein